MVGCFYGQTRDNKHQKQASCTCDERPMQTLIIGIPVSKEDRRHKESSKVSWPSTATEFAERRYDESAKEQFFKKWSVGSYQRHDN